jgi:hypothetical protein
MFTAARSVQTSAGSSLRSRRGNERHPLDKCRQIGGRLELFDGALYAKARTDCARRGCAPVGRRRSTPRCAPNLVSSFTFRTSLSMLTHRHSVIARTGLGQPRQLPDFGRGCAIHDEEIAHDPLDDVGASCSALSSLSSPRATIFSASSRSGRCNALASSHGARIQTSRSSSVVRITGIALGWIGYDGLRRRRQEAVDEKWPGDRLGLGTALAFEFGPDAREAVLIGNSFRT